MKRTDPKPLLLSIFALTSCMGVVGASQAQAQVVTDHKGWRTIRSTNQCVTTRDASSIYEQVAVNVSGAGGLEFVLVTAKRSKYPSLAQSVNKKIRINALIIKGSNIVHRLETSANVYINGDKVQLLFDADLFPYMAEGDTLQVQNKQDAFQNLSVNYANFQQGLADYRQCEAIRLGNVRSTEQPQDAQLSQLPPFDRAKKVCEQEMKQTGGLVAADNPYELDGRRYANACEAAIDYANRKAQQFKAR